MHRCTAQRTHFRRTVACCADGQRPDAATTAAAAAAAAAATGASATGGGPRANDGHCIDKRTIVVPVVG